MTEEHSPPEPTLTEFLLARIAEDKAADIAGRRADLPAEVYAKTTEASFVRLGWSFKRANVVLSPILNRYRAIRYAHHPDYREEWRP